MKRIFSLILTLAATPLWLYAQHSYHLASPDGHLGVEVVEKPSNHFTITRDDQVLVPGIEFSMMAEDKGVLGGNALIKRVKKRRYQGTITPVVPIKNRSIADDYHEMTVEYQGGYRVVFRAYNDAVAYRFETAFGDSITIRNEHCDIRLPDSTKGWFASTDTWVNDYQNPYVYEAVRSVAGDQYIQLPVLLDLHTGGKMLMTESNLRDYPGLYFKSGAGNRLQSVFPPKAKTTRKVGRKIHPDQTYDYIARTNGHRAFPWRVFAFAASDEQLLNNEAVYKLADPNEIKQAGWIRPGQVAWDWWSYRNITGVDFRAGINTATYEYYIDFASRNGISYIMIDDGWFVPGDITRSIPDMDIQQLVRYGAERGVGILLWCTWYQLDERMDEVMALYEKWGVKGIKVDFIERDDQDLTNFYWRCAEQAAKYHLAVDFHGSHKPSGLERTYPNVMNFEGVIGLEASRGTYRGATPANAVTIPFIRMVAGPVDYTPGAMRNAQEKDFRAIPHNPMSQGTRCQQLAMYVIYDAPLQMLSDNPTIYEKNKTCLDFITSVPTTWDETIPLDGKVGQYVVMARKKGSEYFAAAITNADARELTVDFSFLPEGEWQMELMKDGMNADRNGTDFERVVKTITRKDRMTIRMASGGGWAARIFR